MVILRKALDGIKGNFNEGEIYKINENEAEEFDKTFTKKEKLKLDTVTQKRFRELAGKYL